MPHRVEHRRHRLRAADDRQLVDGLRPETDADLLELRALERWNELDGRIEQSSDAFGGRPLVEADVLDCGADEHRAVAPRHDVTSLSPDHVRGERIVAAQLHELATNGLDRRTS